MSSCSNLVLNRIHRDLMKHTLFRCSVRSVATRAPPRQPMNIFDRETKRQQKEFASRNKDAALFDYIKDDFGYRLSDRVYDIKRKFNIAVELGCGRGYVSHHLTNDMVDNMIICDMSRECLQNAKEPDSVNTVKILVDEENLPFRDNSVDLFVTSLSLHWVNNLPKCLAEIMTSLKDDGVFIGSMFGGQTLFELRCSLQLAEVEREGGFAPHISPFTDVQDIGGLLNRAGFTMITIDCDEIQMAYPSIYELMFDLQGMAESNASWNRKSHVHRDTLLAAAAIYQEMYGNADGTVPATFQVYNFIGWKPHESQPLPMARGSANFSLKDIKDLDKIVKKK